MGSERRDGLITRMNKLEEFLEDFEKKNKKKFKLPRKLTKISKMKLKQNYIVVIYIRTNGAIVINQYKIENDRIFIKDSGLWHKVTTESLLNYKGKPFIIQPEWSLTPFIPQEHRKKCEKEGNISTFQDIIIELSEAGNVKPKRGLPAGGKLILLGLIALVVVAYIISKMFGG
jgi:hypothetical protein